jgi:hypothetical protein
MFSRDWKLPNDLPRCLYSDVFYRSAQDSIFSQLTDETTPAHICVGVLYKEASLRLKNLAVLQPEPLPPVIGPQPLTPEDIVDNLENDLPPDPDETYLGEE